jgi:hypothetical protein
LKLKEIKMVDIAVGKYQRISEENFEEVLRVLEVNIFLRKVATASTPQMKNGEEDGLWTIRMSTILKAIERSFRIGEPYDEITADGRDVSSIMTVVGDTFILLQNAKKVGQKSTKAIREFTNDGCILTTEVIGTDVVAVQKYKRI